MKKMALWAVVALVVGAGAYVRLAPSDPARWHVALVSTESQNLPGGVLRVVETGPDGLQRLDEIAREPIEVSEAKRARKNARRKVNLRKQAAREKGEPYPVDTEDDDMAGHAPHDNDDDDSLSEFEFILFDFDDDNNGGDDWLDLDVELLALHSHLPYTEE